MQLLRSLRECKLRVLKVYSNNWNEGSVLIYRFRFLLPTLHMKMILGMPTKFKRREALITLPTDFYGSFKSIITRIQETSSAGQARLGMQVLMWLHFAYRPLRLVELQHALAVEKSHTEFNADNIPPQRVLLNCCLGLVVVDEETLTVRFMHYTLEEYFRIYARTHFPNGCSWISETCVTYITFGKLRQHCTSRAGLEQKLTEYPFLKYAALYWGKYVKQGCNDDLTKVVKLIVDHEIYRPHCAIQTLALEICVRWPNPYMQKFSGTHAIAYFGLSENMADLCKTGRDINLEDEHGQTPLSLAAKYGHESITHMLIKRDDVDVNARNLCRRTPLLLAAKSGHEAVVRLLIDREDIDINAKDMFNRTPLSVAAENGHEAVVRLLIERDDVDIDAKDQYNRTPPLVAAENGHEARVWLHIDRENTDINSIFWPSPLLLAAKNGHEAVVRLLIDRKDIDIIGCLSVAAANGHEAVVQLLIDREDIDINAKDILNRSPLSVAAQNGHEAVVRLLIERDDIDIDAKDNYNRTPLSVAARYGHEAIIRLLIERDDININVEDEDRRTPLSVAARYGYEAVVRLLIEREDIDVNAKDNYNRTPLSVAARYGHEAVMRLLIERDDINIDVEDEDRRTPLSVAARYGHEAVVRLLIERDDIDIDAEDEGGHTPLSLATLYGHEAVLRLLNDRRDKWARDSNIAPAGSFGDVTSVESEAIVGASSVSVQC